MNLLINYLLWGKVHQNMVVAKRVENSEMQLNIQELINGALGLAKPCLFLPVRSNPKSTENDSFFAQVLDQTLYNF